MFAFVGAGIIKFINTMDSANSMDKASTLSNLSNCKSIHMEVVDLLKEGMLDVLKFMQSLLAYYLQLKGLVLLHLLLSLAISYLIGFDQTISSVPLDRFILVPNWF